LGRPGGGTEVEMTDSERALRLAVGRRVERLDRLLRVDGGGIELVDVLPGGKVKVRFTGLCVSCPMRPLTGAATLRPLLLSLSGVTEVEISGSRISAEAEERLALYGVGCGTTRVRAK
jgi:Fe-S cluster biogenesis protein NfuA